MYSWIVYFVVFYINIFHYIFCTVSVKAPCPIVKPVADFNWERYKGLWYEIGRYPDDWQKQGDCTTIEYYNDKGTDIFNISYVANKDRVSMIGTAEVKSSKIIHKTPKFTVSESETEPIFPVTVIAVDYDRYAVVYGCIYNENKKIRQDFLWLISRSHDPDAKIRKKIDDVINASGYINKSKLIYDHLTSNICLLK